MIRKAVLASGCCFVFFLFGGGGYCGDGVGFGGDY